MSNKNRDTVANRVLNTILVLMVDGGFHASGDPFTEYGRRHPGASASFTAPRRGGEPASMRVSGLIDSDTAEDFLEASLEALGTLSRGASIGRASCRERVYGLV